MTKKERMSLVDKAEKALKSAANKVVADSKKNKTKIAVLENGKVKTYVPE